MRPRSALRFVRYVLALFVAFAVLVPRTALAQSLPRVLIRTTLGEITVEVDSVRAPSTSANFLRYVDAGAYRAGHMHRTVRLDNQPANAAKIEVIQGGAARADAARFAPIVLERTTTTGLLHRDGTISMARGGPDTATSDFFVCIGDQPSLDFGGARNADGQGFAAFGQVVAGMAVVRAIQARPSAGQRLTPPVEIVEVVRVQPRPLPEVLILTTGGTIASRATGPMTDGPSLVRGIPALASVATVRVDEVLRVPSSQVTPNDWLRLARRITAELAASPALRGIVVTHGTDTMEETAFFLNLTVRDARPVVVVGSMRGGDEVSADGPANLLNGVRVAASESATGQGVLVVLNEDISAARDVWKTDNRRVETFASPERGYVGAADPDTVVFFRRVLQPHTTASEFELSGLEALPSVEILTDYAGFDSTVMQAAIGRQPRGLVLTSFAGGRLSAGARAAVRMAGAAGIPVVVASRVPGGRIVGTPLGDLPGVLARDLPAHKARVLLMLALTRTSERGALQRIFDRY